MNPPPEGFDGRNSAYATTNTVDIVVFPTFLDIQACLAAELIVGAQYGYPEANGAHTGDVSMAMLKHVGCEYVLCGHSERRRDHKETNDFIAKQVAAALEQELIPVVCIGESLEERQNNQVQEVLYMQLKPVLEYFEKGKAIIAYEPSWAISGGDSTKCAANAADVQSVHYFIRQQLPRTVRDDVRILYGGSMKPENVTDLLRQPDIDGGLVGGASLKPNSFGEIIRIAQSLVD
jgi:triosephosphate isomerase